MIYLSEVCKIRKEWNRERPPRSGNALGCRNTFSSQNMLKHDDTIKRPTRYYIPLHSHTRAEQLDEVPCGGNTTRFHAVQRTLSESETRFLAKAAKQNDNAIKRPIRYFLPVAVLVRIRDLSNTTKEVHRGPTQNEAARC